MADMTNQTAMPELPHTTYNGYADGSEPLYTAEQMRDYARAAIEALSQQGEPASTAQAPAPVADEREAFEKWVRASGRGHMLERSKQGWYIDLNVTAWLAGWLGRAALSAPAQQVEAAQSFKNKVIEALDLGPVNNRITFSDNYLVGLIAELEKEDDSEAAQAPGKQDRIDAERYRWLRGRPIKQMVDEHGIQFTFALAEPEPNRWRVHSKRGEEMDAAIDAARAAQDKA